MALVTVTLTHDEAQALHRGLSGACLTSAQEKLRASLPTANAVRDDRIAVITEILRLRSLPSFAATAEEWVDAGFFTPAVVAWLDARCYTPAAAHALHDAGVGTFDAATLDTEHGGYQNTLGFKVTRGDLNAADAAKLVEHRAQHPDAPPAPDPLRDLLFGKGR